jgi:hypothetical protein
VPHGHRGTRDEEPDRREQRPDVRLPPIPEGPLRVGGTRASTVGDEKEDLIAEPETVAATVLATATVILAPKATITVRVLSPPEAGEGFSSWKALARSIYASVT